MDKRVIVPEDLSPEAFHIPAGHRQFHVRLNGDNDNLLFMTSTGLKAVLSNIRLPEPQYFALNMNAATTNIRGSSPPTEERNYLYAPPNGSTGFGVLVMNFLPRSSSRVRLATLPADAPVPVRQLAAADPRGGQVWIEPGSREILGRELAVGQQVLINISGGFRY